MFSIYLFILSFIYISILMNICFILWIIIQYFYILLCKSSQLWVLGALSFSWFLCPFEYPIIAGFMFWYFGRVLLFAFLNTSLLSGTNKRLQAHFIHFQTVLEAAISPKSPGFFYWRRVLGTKIGVLDVSYIFDLTIHRKYFLCE